jgi:hypothetical protein
VESEKWRNLEQLGRKKTNASPKRQKRDGKEGSFPGRGSESQIKSSRKKKKKAAFAAVTCHAKRGFSGQTPKKKKEQQRQLLTVFFFSPSNFYPQSYFSSNFCPQSCSYSRLFPVPFSRETQERARARARDTISRARALAARDPQTQRLFCR